MVISTQTTSQTHIFKNRYSQLIQYSLISIEIYAETSFLNTPNSKYGDRNRIFGAFFLFSLSLYYTVKAATLLLVSSYAVEAATFLSVVIISIYRPRGLFPAI
jgi:hypothetical protein